MVHKTWCMQYVSCSKACVLATIFARCVCPFLEISFALFSPLYKLWATIYNSMSISIIPAPKICAHANKTLWILIPALEIKDIFLVLKVCVLAIICACCVCPFSWICFVSAASLANIWVNIPSNMSIPIIPVPEMCACASKTHWTLNPVLEICYIFLVKRYEFWPHSVRVACVPFLEISFFFAASLTNCERLLLVACPSK